MRHRMTRRTFLTAAAAGTAVAAFPAVLRAQARTIKVGVISPVTGAVAEVGRDCRLGAQLAAEAINAAGGTTSPGGPRLQRPLPHPQPQPHRPRPRADTVTHRG